MLKIISLRDRFASTAKTDIKCYKVLERKSSDKNVAHSPYQDHPFVLRQEETAFLTRKFFSGKVEHGIHAFLNLSDAKKLQQELISNRRRRDTYDKIKSSAPYSDNVWNYMLKYHKEVMQQLWNDTPARPIEIFECVVPQGAKFYKGVWEAKYPDKMIPNIAASKLTVLRGINDVEEVVVPEEQKAESTVEQTVEERLASIAASVASLPDSGPPTYYTSVTTTTTYSK